MSMSHPELLLYHFPGACSQVSVFALEQAGLPYKLELVDLSKDAQSHPDYLAISPMGKVPTLLIDGEPLTENAAIQIYVAALCPDAGLFPIDPAPRIRAEIVSGLAFCGGTLHPQVRGIANPSRMTTGDGAPVREKAVALAKKSFGHAERRIAQRVWWLGQWSSIDVYLNWAFTTACRGGFDSTDYPALSALPERLAAWPAFGRMMEGESRARTTLGLPG
jgi:glutathione S-transferase